MTTQTECECGASRFPGAQHQNGCTGQSGESDPIPPPINRIPQPPAGERRRVDAPYQESKKSLRIKFMPGLPQPYDSQFGEEGEPTERTVGSLVGTFKAYRNAQTTMGTTWFLDIELEDGTEAGVLCGMRLQQLITQCNVGQKIEIVRLPDRGQDARL